MVQNFKNKKANNNKKIKNKNIYSCSPLIREDFWSQIQTKGKIIKRMLMRFLLDCVWPVVFFFDLFFLTF